MRVLLDACIPERFARFVPGHDVTTRRAFFGTTDVDDGPVLDRITDMFDAFVTVDKHLRVQQNLRGRPFRIVLLRTHSNAIENLVPLVPQLLVALSQMQPGDLRAAGSTIHLRGALTKLRAAVVRDAIPVEVPHPPIKAVAGARTYTFTRGPLAIRAQ